MMRKIRMIKKDCVEEMVVKSISAEEIGQKAYGLCQMPSAWTLPFFVISRELFVDYIRHKENAIICYEKNIVKLIQEMDFGEKVIIRSSGLEEGMNERGRYESRVVEVKNVAKELCELIEELEKYQELREIGMPFLIQPYVDNCISGHISNERRFVKENRDFIFEYRSEEKKEVEAGKISLRNWRKTYDLKSYINRSLSREMDFKNLMKIVGAFYYYQKKRVHLEFVCSNAQMYIVQCDYEKLDVTAENPENYDISMPDTKHFNPQILKLIDDEDKGKYRKIDNAFIYEAVGEKRLPLYLIKNKKTLEELCNGIISEELLKDLEFMTAKSLVIRTNIVDTDLKKTQLSKRSNEIRCLEDAKKFLIETSQYLKHENVDEYIFILHNFIPARIAAFVNAKPKESVVEMQVLWGLPEGLYYNAHDRIVINTCTIDINKMDKHQFVIRKNAVYKENYIAPDKNGKWVVKKLKPPYDWRCTILDDEMIKDIACRARKIAEYVDDELSIMWFIGIDKEFYGIDNIPWYHEHYDRDNLYYARGKGANRRYKKKYFYEKEVVVETEGDLEKLNSMDPKEIGIVCLKPVDDSLLRSRKFIEKVGTICKERNISIFLEGSVLAHSYYQLINTGVNVLRAYEADTFEEAIEYNKLVRDLVPRNIRENGEQVILRAITGIGFLEELKNKVLEEAYEVFDAEGDMLIEELADLEEVCDALIDKMKVIEGTMQNRILPETTEHEVEFDLMVHEYSKQSAYVRLKKEDVYITFEKQKTDFRIDFILGRRQENGNSEFQKESEDEAIRDILICAYKLLRERNKDECNLLLYEIKTNISNILLKKEIEQKCFNAIKSGKRERKGGFERGYILLKTSMENIKPKLLDKEELVGEPVEIYTLEHSTRIDVDSIRGNRVLIRLTIPLYSHEAEWRINNNRKICEYLKKNASIRITKRIELSSMFVGIEIVDQEYEQMKLDL